MFTSTAAIAVVCCALAQSPGPEKGLEGLGFSMAPAEEGKGRTSFFGLVGEGYKFVYVVDRSGSMSAGPRDALRVAKAELVRSIRRLDSVHQFQLIFYNERPLLFNPSGMPGRLALATERNKQQAEQFIDSVRAFGGTGHEDALRLAIRLHPDVIFLLTDAADPPLTPGQLTTLRDLAAGIVIHAVEFGEGPKPAGENFLAQLARQTGGQYAYVDVSRIDEK